MYEGFLLLSCGDGEDQLVVELLAMVARTSSAAVGEQIPISSSVLAIGMALDLADMSACHWGIPSSLDRGTTVLWAAFSDFSLV